MPSVGMGIREYTSWWISGAGVLFSVALSISLTLSPLTSHLWWALWYLWKHRAALAGGQRHLLAPSASLPKCVCVRVCGVFNICEKTN